MITFVKAEEKDLPALAAMASQVWHEFFPCILSLGQIDYMVEKFQSEQAMARQIQNGYSYYFIQAEDARVGYIGIQPKDGKLFLSKLYLLKDYRGKGYAGKAFAFLEDLCREKGLNSIWLTVNRHNDHAVDVYRSKGFAVVREEKTDIGSGYFMDDYIMELTL